MKNFLSHTRVYIFRGIFAIIPLVLSYLALQFLYVVIDKRIIGLFDQYIGVKIPGLGILILLVVLYFIGLITSNVIGKQLLHLLERIIKRIPLINTTYHIGKQLSTSLSLPEKQLFKKVVLVQLKPGVWTVGFVTGVIKDSRTGEDLLRVLIPTVPNPATGFVLIVKASEAVDSKWSVEEALKIVISGGIIGPDDVG